MGYRTRRRDHDVLALVLAHAQRDPDGGLPYDSVPEARATFRDRRELLLALQREWTHALWTRIEAHAARRGPRPLDPARLAWSECCERHPVLRRLLDTHGQELGPSPGRAVA